MCPKAARLLWRISIAFCEQHVSMKFIKRSCSAGSNTFSFLVPCWYTSQKLFSVLRKPDQDNGKPWVVEGINEVHLSEPMMSQMYTAVPEVEHGLITPRKLSQFGNQRFEIVHNSSTKRYVIDLVIRLLVRFLATMKANYMPHVPRNIPERYNWQCKMRSQRDPQLPTCMCEISASIYSDAKRFTSTDLSAAARLYGVCRRFASVSAVL